jgi:predicted dehydrogenase
MGAELPWHEHPQGTVEAVAELREDRREALVKRFAPKRVYATLEELVRDRNVDAVAVFTDAPLHVDHVELAMKHGKHKEPGMVLNCL